MIPIYRTFLESNTLDLCCNTLNDANNSQCNVKPVPAPSSLTVNCLTFKFWDSNYLDVAMTTWT